MDGNIQDLCCPKAVYMLIDQLEISKRGSACRRKLLRGHLGHSHLSRFKSLNLPYHERISGLQVTEPGEVSIGAQELAHTVVDAKGRDSCIMYPRSVDF